MYHVTVTRDGQVISQSSFDAEEMIESHFLAMGILSIKRTGKPGQNVVVFVLPAKDVPVEESPKGGNGHE